MKSLLNVNPTRIMLLAALRYGPKRLLMNFVGERRSAGIRSPAELVVQAIRVGGAHMLTGTLSFERSKHGVEGAFNAWSHTAELNLSIERLGACVLRETELPRARLQTGLSLGGDFADAPNCALELGLDFKQLYRDLC